MSDIKYLVVFIIFFLGKMNEENILEEILKDAADLVWPENDNLEEGEVLDDLIQFPDKPVIKCPYQHARAKSSPTLSHYAGTGQKCTVRRCLYCSVKVAPKSLRECQTSRSMVHANITITKSRETK